MSDDAPTPLGSEAALAAIRGDAWRQLPLQEAEVWLECCRQNCFAEPSSSASPDHGGQPDPGRGPGGRSEPARWPHSNHRLRRKVDAVTIPVPDLDAGLAFYGTGLGHRLRWRNDELGQAALGLPDSDTEIVLSTGLGYEPNWLVKSADTAAETVREAGGTILHEASDISMGRLLVGSDPFGNVLVMLDMSKGTYTTDSTGKVTGVEPPDQ